MVCHWKSYPFKKGQVVLVDTNIWIKAFPKTSNPGKSNPYANFIADLVRYDVYIALDVLVVSEFITTFIHIEHDKYNRKCQRDNIANPYRKYKDFRSSELFFQAASDAAFALKEILNCPNVKRIDHPFKNVDINRLLEKYQKAEADLTDLLLMETCGINAFVMATLDTDYAMARVDVVTDNDKLLAMSVGNGSSDAY